MQIFLLFTFLTCAFGASTTIFTSGVDSASAEISNESSCENGECSSVKYCLKHDGVIQDSSLCTCPDVYCCYFQFSDSETSTTIESIHSSTSAKELSSLPYNTSDLETYTSSALEMSETSTSTYKMSVGIDLDSNTPSPSPENTTPTQESGTSLDISTINSSSSETGITNPVTISLLPEESGTPLDVSTIESSSSETGSTTSVTISLLPEESGTPLHVSTIESSSSETESTTPVTISLLPEQSGTLLHVSTTNDMVSSETESTTEGEYNIWFCTTAEQCYHINGEEGVNMNDCSEPYIKCNFPRY